MAEPMSAGRLADLRRIATDAAAVAPGRWRLVRTPNDAPQIDCEHGQVLSSLSGIAAVDGHVVAFEPQGALALLDEISRMRETLHLSVRRSIAAEDRADRAEAALARVTDDSVAPRVFAAIFHPADGDAPRAQDRVLGLIRATAADQQEAGHV